MGEVRVPRTNLGCSYRLDETDGMAQLPETEHVLHDRPCRAAVARIGRRHAGEYDRQSRAGHHAILEASDAEPRVLGMLPNTLRYLDRKSSCMRPHDPLCRPAKRER